ncbi:type II secretion system protein [Heliorestis convoluta]|uniref:Prepilin-type N-terminal cleavage/methylation domain protein n=1 Tax=Heliorestis convoluta TaxID=356322 RepID=A0A5Q2MW38_9FIRM|nr:type II secretion system protein [Heliorestis convoluta]QGG46584.1 prepilin-type N-terminal cleavage/methylation domain protein [Heliorestis convoluta]
MFQRVQKAMKNQKGFTLVELMVVVAIIGVLVSIAVMSFGGSTDSAREGAAKADARSIQSACLLIKSENMNDPSIDLSWDEADYTRFFDVVAMNDKYDEIEIGEDEEEDYCYVVVEYENSIGEAVRIDSKGNKLQE